jgi:hypothetical protein
MRSSQNSTSETVWKFEMGGESGLRKWLRRVQGSPIGRFLAPKKCAREAFRYFPNSFSTTFMNKGKGEGLGFQTQAR